MLFILLHLIGNIFFLEKIVHFVHKPRKSASSVNVEEANSRACAILEQAKSPATILYSCWQQWLDGIIL